VTGTATLGGTLDVSLSNGFAPAVGTSFDILTFKQHSGDFAAENGLNLRNGLVFAPAYRNGALALTVSR
jgi:hypothetical protein